MSQYSNRQLLAAQANRFFLHPKISRFFSQDQHNPAIQFVMYQSTNTVSEMIGFFLHFIHDAVMSALRCHLLC